MKGATHWPFPNNRNGYPYFNPRTREGCDISVVDAYDAGDMISIHAPVKGATFYQRSNHDLNIYFNPRTREGCDVQEKIMDLIPFLISIHAPVKGATMATFDSEHYISISIHAPVKGATITSLVYFPANSYFNPRTREGCDDCP